MAVRGVNPYADETDNRTATSSSRGSNPNARGVAPADPYADERADNGNFGITKKTQPVQTPSAKSYEDTRGTAASPTLNQTNPYGGNVTKYGGMSDEELMLLYHNGIDSNNWLGYDLDPLRYELRSRGMAEAADNVNAFRNKKIDANDLGYDLEYWNERTQRYEPRTLKAPTLEADTAGYYPDDIYDWFYNAAERSRDERTKTIDEQSKNQEDMIRAQYEYAIWKAQQELKNSLENGKARYNQAVAQNAISSLQAADNLALRNAAAGDMGGIGGKLYSDQQASFDAQLGDIRNEELRLYNETEQQAALLEAQGRYEEAQAIRQIGAEKLQYLLNMQDELWNAGREDYKWLMNYGMNYQQQTRDIEQQALQNALTRMQLGILGPDDVEALGVSPDQAQAVADRYNQMAQIDLESARLGLQQQAANLGVTQAKLVGTYGGSGSGGSGGGGGGSYYAQKIASSGNDAMALYGSLMAAGAVDKGSALSWLLSAGYKDTNANRLAEAYAEWYAGQQTKGYDAWDYKSALYNQGYLNPSEQADAELYLRRAMGFSEEEAAMYAASYFTWLEGQLSAARAAERPANAANPYALALTAGDASLDNVGAGTDGLLSGQGALGFSNIPMTNDHTETTVYIEGRPYTQSQFATLLSNGQIKDIGTNAMHHFINAASPEWDQTQPWAERTPIQEVIPYNSVLELTDAFMAGDISEADYTYWLSRLNSSYGIHRPSAPKLPSVDVNSYLANNTVAGAYQSALESLNKGNPYTLPDSYWKTYGQER